ncbi:hypothetical protein ACGFYP_26595 [Streptomyces sp. NPDC048370]|uniref:hypothetical protein n=1 Tax=Streptomyces sp. NPDC048370 TaxID=3365540 RepID=UPI0037102555
MPTDTGRTPQDLVAELKDELAVDWPGLWQGLPQLGGPEFHRLFEGYGWEYDVPVHERGSVPVRTRTGAHLTIEMDTLFRVRRVVHDAWRTRAGDPTENDAVLTRATQDWPLHVKAVESVLGTPTWSGSWNAPDFPEPPDRSYWADGSYRLEHRSPHALAHWKPAEDEVGRPWVVLHQSIHPATRTTTRPGGSALTLNLWAPPESSETS